MMKCKEVDKLGTNKEKLTLPVHLCLSCVSSLNQFVKNYFGILCQRHCFMYMYMYLQHVHGSYGVAPFNKFNAQIKLRITSPLNFH